MALPLAGTLASPAAADAGTKTDTPRLHQGAKTAGEHWMYFLPVYWSGSEPSNDPSAGVEAAVSDADSYWRDVSGGRVSVSLGWAEQWSRITMSATEIATCDTKALTREALNLIEGAGDSRDHLVVALPGYSQCDFTDLEFLGPSSQGLGITFTNGPVNNTWVTQRAMLHNNWVSSTGTLDCLDGSTPVPLGGSCKVTDYNNPWDPASDHPYGEVGSPLASTLWRLGTVSDTEYPQLQVGIPRSMTIARNGSSTGTRGFYFDMGGYRYHVDYRTAAGRDSWIDTATYVSAGGAVRTDPGGGVTVHRQSLTDGQYVRAVVDFHPETRVETSTQRHPGLAAGESYTSPDSFFKLTVSSANASSATVDVSFPALQKVTRWSGPDRYSTSATISSRTFSPGVDVAYVASGNVYTDALSGAPVAGMTRGPILLTKADSVPDPIVAELRRLNPKKVVVFGGTATIQDSVLTQIGNVTGAPVTRWSGPDRFSTSAQISANSYPAGVGTAYIASGRVFTDALSGAPVAGKTDGPVLLVDTNSVPSSIAAELARLKPNRIVIFGGSSTISTGVEATLGSYAASVVRWSGPDRFTTSTAITSQSYAAPTDTVFIASGRVYTDALSGAPVAGATKGPILLSDTTRLPDAVATELARLKPSRIVVLGGENTLSYGVQAALSAYVTPR
jgi:putative cell wall-binding protein